jgi:hypothetical protein
VSGVLLDALRVIAFIFHKDPVEEGTVGATVSGYANGNSTAQGYPAEGMLWFRYEMSPPNSQMIKAWLSADNDFEK